MKIFLFFLIVGLNAIQIGRKTLHCQNGSKIQYSQDYYPVFNLSNENDNKIKKNKNIIELLAKFQIINNMTDVAYVQRISEQIVLVIQINELQFEHYTLVIDIEVIDNKTWIKSIEKTKKQLLEMKCQRIREIFNVQNDEKYTFYWFTKTQFEDFNSQQFYATQNIKKKPNCKQKIRVNFLADKLYFSFVQCIDWIVYTIQSTEVNIIAEASQYSYGKLIDISVELQILLIFKNEVWEIKQFSLSDPQKIYQNYNKEILNFQYVLMPKILNIIFLKDQTETHFESNDNELIIFGEEIPKTIFTYNLQIYIICQETIIFIYNQFELYSFNIKTDWLFLHSIYYPYIFGFNDNFIQLLRVNHYFPFISCDDLQDNQTVLFRTNNFQSKIKILEVEIQITFNNSQSNQFFQHEFINQVFLVQISCNYQLFQIESFYNSSISQPLIFYPENNYLNCQQKEHKTFKQCLNYEDQIIWKKYIILFEEQFIVYQQQNGWIYLKNCNNDQQKQIVMFEATSSENVFVYDKIFCLLYHNLHQIFILSLIQYPNIILKEITFENQIVSIVFLKLNIEVIFIECYTIKIDYYQLVNYSKNFYFNPQHLLCDNKSKVFQDQLINFNSQQIYIMQSHSSFIFTFKFVNILDILYNESDESIIIGLEDNKQVGTFSKYIFYGNQLKQIFDLPKYHFQYYSPMRYVQSKQYLAVLAFQNLENKLEINLLIYNLNNDFDNILVDIIQNIDPSKFEIIFNQIIIFYKQNIQYFQQIGKFSTTCIPKFDLRNYELTFQLPMILKSKFQEQQQQETILNLRLVNQIQNLTFRNKYTLEEIEMSFDLRHYVIGPVNYIMSESYDIRHPLNLIKTFERFECEKMLKNICVNQKQNMIRNIFNQAVMNQIDDSKDLFVEKNIIIISEIQKPNLYIQLFNMNFDKINEFYFPYFTQIQSVFIEMDYLFLVFENQIQIYRIEQTIKFLNIIEIICHKNCLLFQMPNKPNSFILYNTILKNNFILYIQMNFQKQCFDYERFQIHSLSKFFDIQFMDMYLEVNFDPNQTINNQQNITIYLFDNEISLYVYEYIFDLKKKTTLNKKSVRNFKNLEKSSN